MGHDFVHALSPFGILLIGWHEARTDTFVAWFPRFAAVVRAVDPASRDRDIKVLRIRWIGKDGVETETTAARHPLGAVWMIEQAAIERPGLAAVRGFVKRSGFDATVKRICVMRILHDLPNLLERNI